MKDCPFCGGKAKIYTDDNYPFSSDTHSHVYCKKCGAQTKNYRTENEAVKAWNNRIKDKQCKE